MSESTAELPWDCRFLGLPSTFSKHGELSTAAQLLAEANAHGDARSRDRLSIVFNAGSHTILLQTHDAFTLLSGRNRRYESETSVFEVRFRRFHG